MFYPPRGIKESNRIDPTEPPSERVDEQPSPSPAAIIAAHNKLHNSRTSVTMSDADFFLPEPTADAPLAAAPAPFIVEAASSELTDTYQQVQQETVENYDSYEPVEMAQYQQDQTGAYDYSDQSAALPIVLGPPPVDNQAIIMEEVHDAPIIMGLPDPIPSATEEQSPMAMFNNEWQVTLRERKDAENAAKAEAVNRSQEDMDNFIAQREATREARMAKNRTEEQAKLEMLEADLEQDNSWVRVVKLVDLQQDSVDGDKDVSRMRDVFIHLKNEPEKANLIAVA